MEIRELAERVLFGRTLADKLLRPDGPLTDHRPGPAITRPDAPGRPPGLGPARRARIPFPARSELHRDEIRGRVLHRFANHELMAIELMALALLRFPEAPAAFRRGVAGALFEEQTHFELYRDRMQALGCALGEVPASPLFWDILAPMADPMDYVTGMSLTFEQANLDFARHYREVFAEVGDAETAAVLHRVYEDEIGHVKLGLVWFRRWRTSPAPSPPEATPEPPPSDWEAWCAALPDRLQPSRAKGIGFDVEGRRRAGFDEGYIRRLRVFQQSKGRVPTLHRFNPTAEIELTGRTPPAAARRLARDLETLPMFVCARDDAVQVTRAPRPGALEPLARAGFVLPDFVTPGELAGRRFATVRPWAAIAGALEAGEAQVDRPATPTPPALFGKAWAAAQLGALADELPCPVDPALVGVPCPDRAAVEAQIARLRAAGFGPIAVKAALSTAGAGIRRIAADDMPHTGYGIPEADDILPRRWLTRALGGGPVIVEPWLDRVLDLGIQLTVRSDGVQVDGVGRNLVDTRGHHRGVALVPLATGLPIPLRIFLMSRPVQETLQQVGARIGAALAEAGHRGPAAIDALIYRDGDGFGLKPIVEVNPRCSMGRIALALKRRVARGSSAVWLQQPADRAPRDADFETRGDPPVIVEGVLPTTDPVDARFATTLFVAPRFEILRARLRQAVGSLPVADPAFAIHMPQSSITAR